MTISERILKLGDDINTDDIIPAKRGTNADPNYLARYALEHVIGEGKLLEYDIIEAGYNFGCGSSREFAPIAIKAAGIKKVRARSFAEIFYRNSINIGLSLEIIGDSQSNPVVEAIASAGGLIPFNQKRLAGKVSVPNSLTKARLGKAHAMRTQTMAEKMIARASGNAYVRPGEVVFAQVDLAMSHDAIAGPVAQLFYDSFGKDAKIWNRDRLVLVADHFIQINDIRKDEGAITMYQQMIQFARDQGCHLLDVVSPGEAAGICHVLLPEKGFIRPGMVIAGTDSHSCTYGAFGCFSTGIGTTDMANLFATGDMWIRVPATILIELSGTLPPYISAKDIMLFILGQIGCHGATGKAIEFRGSIIEQLPVDERMTLANMAIECGAMCGLIAPDAITLEYIQSRTSEDFEVIVGDCPKSSGKADRNAEYDTIYRFDLSDLEPQIACPPKPDRVVSISQLGEVPITKAFIGSCTGGKLFDLAQAAEVLKGRTVNPNVSLFVVPASKEVLQQAEKLGYLDILERAGAQVLKSGCGACINAGIGVLGKKETGIYATNRNFKGRSGDPSASNYLASPRIVAISAIKGKICDRASS
jgi:homoaconitate hydratase family protein/3-isopropylmalate dehydratase small subunit